MLKGQPTLPVMPGARPVEGDLVGGNAEPLHACETTVAQQVAVGGHVGPQFEPRVPAMEFLEMLHHLRHQIGGEQRLTSEPGEGEAIETTLHPARQEPLEPHHHRRSHAGMLKTLEAVDATKVAGLGGQHDQLQGVGGQAMALGRVELHHIKGRIRWSRRTDRW